MYIPLPVASPAFPLHVVTLSDYSAVSCRFALYLCLSLSHTQGCESTVVRGKAPLDPPYPPPSDRTSKRESEGEIFVQFSRPDVWTAAARSQFRKRRLSHGCVCANICVSVWSLSWTLPLTDCVYSPFTTPF